MWLKVTVGCKNIGALCDKMPARFEIGGYDDQEGCFVVFEEDKEALRQAVWALNGGGYCDITEISEDVADSYC